GAIRTAELDDAFERRAEPFGDADRRFVIDVDETDHAVPAERFVGEGPDAARRLLGEAASAHFGRQRPADFASGEPLGRPEAGPAGESARGLVLQDPMSVAAQNPVADIGRHPAPRVVARVHASDVTRLILAGVNRRERFEVRLAPPPQDQPLAFEDGNHFFLPNGLMLPPRPGSLPPPRLGNCGGRLKAPGGGATGMPGAPGGRPGGRPPPICFCMASICSGVGIGMPPPRPIIWPSLPIMPRLPPAAPPIIFIMSAICRCCFRSRLTCSTLTPAPAAMRFLREAFKMSGLRRSCGVIDEMIARWRLTNLSSRLAELSWSLILATPGSMPMMPPIP